jgi:hypothetical protein
VRRVVRAGLGTCANDDAEDFETSAFAWSGESTEDHIDEGTKRSMIRCLQISRAYGLNGLCYYESDKYQVSRKKTLPKYQP